MLIPAIIILLLFTPLYGVFVFAILYHLKTYTIPGRPHPRVVTTIFLFLSTLLWLFALYFLFKIPY